ncbi:hypothetical protein D3C71_25820 [compost metagenome]
MNEQTASTAPLSPRAKELGLTMDQTYFDHDTGMREPLIPSTEENWENGTLGCDERYVRAVTLAEGPTAQGAAG